MSDMCFIPSRFTLNVNENGAALIQTVNVNDYESQELYEDGSVYLVTHKDKDFKRTNIGRIKLDILKEALEKVVDDFLDVNLLLDKQKYL